MADTPTRRTDINFDEFRKLLDAERARLLALHREQRADMIGEASDSGDELSRFSLNEHGDTAAALADLERDGALDQNIKDELNQIDRALARLDEGTYGICEVTGEPLPVARLRALPMATMTVEAAERVGR